MGCDRRLIKREGLYNFSSRHSVWLPYLYCHSRTQRRLSYRNDWIHKRKCCLLNKGCLWHKENWTYCAGVAMKVCKSWLLDCNGWSHIFPTWWRLDAEDHGCIIWDWILNVDNVWYCKHACFKFLHWDRGWETKERDITWIGWRGCQS